jgi:chromosome segregation ATPase
MCNNCKVALASIYKPTVDQRDVHVTIPHDMSVNKLNQAVQVLRELLHMKQLELQEAQDDAAKMMQEADRAKNEVTVERSVERSCRLVNEAEMRRADSIIGQLKSEVMSLRSDVGVRDTEVERLRGELDAATKRFVQANFCCDKREAVEADLERCKTIVMNEMERREQAEKARDGYRASWLAEEERRQTSEAKLAGAMDKLGEIKTVMGFIGDEPEVMGRTLADAVRGSRETLAMQRDRALSDLNEAKRVIRDLRSSGDQYDFVPDQHGGHLLARTGDKWYPESYALTEVARVKREIENKIKEIK